MALNGPNIKLYKDPFKLNFLSVPLNKKPFSRPVMFLCIIWFNEYKKHVTNRNIFMTFSILSTFIMFSSQTLDCQRKNSGN